MKKLVIVIVLLFALTGVFVWAPGIVEKRMNAVLPHASYPPSERARELHRRLFIADLHADSLLWGRDLLRRGRRGHVDIPRLIEGGVALQSFTVVTKSPRGLNIERNEDRSDDITLLALVQRWPVGTWRSLKERALYQARRLHETAAHSNGKLVLIKTAADLSHYLDRRSREPDIVAGFLGIEGAHALDGDLANLDVLFDAGFRMISPTHFFDNEIGGSAHGVQKAGLTPMGKEMIRRMEAKRMLVDLAHASSTVNDEVLAMATRPVVVSHTGVKGTCDNTRNLSDEHIKGVARTGGVIGIGYWDTAVCGTDARAIVRAIRYVAHLVGPTHVGLGSDYDGAITAPFDTSELIQIIDALLADGFSEEDVARIMGGNVLRVLRETLP